jgi:hypothetical protein
MSPKMEKPPADLSLFVFVYLGIPVIVAMLTIIYWMSGGE